MKISSLVLSSLGLFTLNVQADAGKMEVEKILSISQQEIVTASDPLAVDIAAPIPRKEEARQVVVPPIEVVIENSFKATDTLKVSTDAGVKPESIPEAPTTKEMSSDEEAENASEGEGDTPAASKEKGMEPETLPEPSATEELPSEEASIKNVPHLPAEEEVAIETPLKTDQAAGKDSLPQLDTPTHSQAQASSSVQVRESAYQMFRLSGEFLYLQAKEEGLEYGTLDTAADSGPVSQIGVKGHVKRIQPEYHPGCRLGLGYLLPKEKGEAKVQWMHYEGSQGNAVSMARGKGIWPDWMDMVNAPKATKAHANWHLQMNVLDILMGTPFTAKKFLTLQPFAGFRAAWIEQSVNVLYGNITFTGRPSNTTAFIDSRNHSSSSSYGVNAGVDTKWKIWKGFSFFASGNASLLWTRFNLHQKESIPGGASRSNLKDKVSTTVPVIELRAGLVWEHHWNPASLEIGLGWEEQVWMHTNMLDRYIDSFSHGSTLSSKGNLSLSGCHAHLGLRF